MARNPSVETYANEGTPLMIRGVLYVSTSLSQVAAIDAATGRTLWVHDPKVWTIGTPPNLGWAHRGVAYWTDGRDERIFIGTGNAYLIALDARTGTLIRSFGMDGRIDLTEGLGRLVDRLWYSVTSPPVVVRDVAVVGASIHDFPIRSDMPPGHVRGFDARTGRPRWIFHSIPQDGEVGNETWQRESWKTVGGVNVWAPMSADEELGYVYLPVSTPANDYYGGHRPGDNLFAESLVCLDAATGRRVWHFQVVRHPLWDYDLPAAPNLVDVTVNEQRIKAVAQVTKPGFVSVFDRVTGRPVWPVEERPVPQSLVPGEQTAATQPFPTRPAPFERQGVRPEDVIDFTQEGDKLTRTDFVECAGASGDFNPIRHDQTFAEASGNPTVFAMGMLSAGILSRVVTTFAGRPSVRRYKVRFSTRAWPGDDVVCCGISSCGGRCLRMADYVRGPAATRGADRIGDPTQDSLRHHRREVGRS